MSPLLGVSQILRGVALCESQNHLRNGQHPSLSEPLFPGFPCMNYCICQEHFLVRITLEKPQSRWSCLWCLSHARLCDPPMGRSILPRFLNSTPDVLECDSWHVRALQCLGKVRFIGVWTRGDIPWCENMVSIYGFVCISIWYTYLFSGQPRVSILYWKSTQKILSPYLSLSLPLHIYIYIYLCIHIRIHIKIHL